MGDRSVSHNQDRGAGALPPVWNVPHLRNPHFTGRQDLLRRLREALTSGHHAALTQAIHGLGGVGKTQLAVEYCYRHQAGYEVVWWVRAEEPATPAADYAALAAELGLPEKDAQEQERVVGAVRRWLEHNGKWLLVLDNAPDPESVRTYLPRAATGHVIITSRHATWRGVAKPVDVPVWPVWEAMEFLVNRTGEDDPELAADLAEALGYLPLALEQAAAYIEEVGACSMAGYLDLFRKQHQELLRKGKCSTGYEGKVATTWEMSFRQVEEESKAGAALLNLCAFLAPDDIPLSLFAESAEFLPAPLHTVAADRAKLNDAVAAARRYSLLQVSGESLSIHRLVQEVARGRLKLADEQSKWAEAAVRSVSAAFPYEADDPTTWEPSGRLLPHGLASGGHAEEAGAATETAWNLMNLIGLYLERRAEFGQAKAVLVRAVALAEAAFGPHHPDVADGVNNLGIVLRDLGDLTGAKECFERALRMGEAAYGPDHPEVAIRVNNLGLVLQDLGDLAGARECLERALRIGEAVYGPDHPEVAIRVNNLGLVLQDLGDLVGARECLERALRIDEAAYGPDHPEVATDVNNLGRVLLDLGDLAGAKECFERALRIHEAVYGADHPRVATDVNNLGGLLRAMGDLAGAKECFERALRIDEAVYGADHPEVATDVNNLGNVLRDLGDLARARECYERALAIRVRFLGEDHPKTKTVRENLASLGRPGMGRRGGAGGDPPRRATDPL